MLKIIRNTCFILSCLIGLTLTSYASAAIQRDATAIPSLAPMLDKTMPAIVNISAQGELPPFQPLPEYEQGTYEDEREFSDFYPGSRKFENLGSGVIVDTEQGYIITNDHVIRHAKTITVTLNDGRRVDAKLIGADAESDLAVLQIEAEELHTLPIGDSDKIHVGDFVIAIGNPFGLNNFGSNHTATFGIVSALQRSDLHIEGVENFIQTDAAINPGNSGGALVNMQGELIGINTAIISPYYGNVGIGFAIPINLARQVMDQLVEYGSIQRGLMGIFVQHLTPELAEALNVPNAKGALVTQVNAGSPAEQAGLHPGDIIQEVNDTPITTANQVKIAVSLLRVGSNVEMRILRNGKSRTITATVTDVQQHEQQLQTRHPFLYGLALTDFAQTSPQHDYVQGVQIVGATEISAGWRAGLRPGDVIVGANQQTVTNLADLERIAQASTGPLLVHILRGHGSLFLVIS